MADQAAIQAGRDMQKLAATSNPLEVIQNPIVVATSLGILGAYLFRKYMYTSQREIFGWASKDSSGRVRFYGTKKDAKGNIVPDTTKEVEGAYRNRIVLNLGGVLAGTLLINNRLTEDPMVDYLGLGVASGSFANLVMTLMNID
jgi:hypothetical protein